jgi:hypothetical protein
MDFEYEESEFTPKKWHTNMLGINGFFGGWNFALCWQRKNPMWNVQMAFLKKNTCHILKEKKSKVYNHIWTMSSWKLPKQIKILNFFYFPIWPFTKFGSHLLLMTSSPSYFKKLKKKNLTLYTITMFSFQR